MPVPTTSVPWAGSLLWLAAVTVVAFGVSWLFANRLRMPRTPYIGVLSVVTLALAWGYVAWLGLGVGEVLAYHWVWGLLVAPLAAAFLVVGMTRLPSTQHHSGSGRVGVLLWEGVVYGVAEGVLLSALPAFIAWQAVESAGWDGTSRDVARWAFPLVASVVVIVVHHLGYWEYRNRLLVPIAVGCGLLTVGFLVTGSVWAAALGHVLAHASSIRHGAELPPHPHERAAERAVERGRSAA